MEAEPAIPLPAPEPASEATHKLPHSKIGQFIEKYTIFLSSFVLGIAGLVGTAIHQNNQTQIEAKKAESDIAISRNEADVKWKIARAEILSKHLPLLINSKDEQSVDQRYGILLSLTREDIIDPELAMSYAFDLNNSEYIKSVILSIGKKQYTQIFHNFKLTCDLRYGLSKDVPTCRATRRYDERAEAMTDVVAEEVGRALANKQAAATTAPPKVTGPRPREEAGEDPFTLLTEERFVHTYLVRLFYLFEPYFTGVYERQQYAEIERFEAQSKGAALLAAFALAASPSVNTAGVDAHDVHRAQFHEVRRERLEQAVLDPGCDPECKGQAAELLLNGMRTYGDTYSGILRKLLERDPTETANALGRLHARLLWCQVDPDGQARVVQDVLLPAYTDLLRASAAKVEKEKGKEKDKAKEKEKGRARAIDGVIDLLALAPLGEGVKLPPELQRALEPLRARAKHMRESPPVSAKATNFCAAKDEAVSTDDGL